MSIILLLSHLQHLTDSIIHSEAPCLKATHICSEKTVQQNTGLFKVFGEEVGHQSLFEDRQ